MIKQLTTDQLDALKELVNVGVGKSAGMLNEMIEFRIRLQVPNIKLLTMSELQTELGARLGEDQLASVQLAFSGSFAGTAQLVFPTESAATLVAVLTGEEPGSPDLDALKIGTLTEVGNIVINGVMGSISNMLTQPLHYEVPAYIEVPVYIEEDINNLVSNKKTQQNMDILLAQARFNVEELQVQGDIILFFGVGSFETLLTAIEDVG
ncbi:chemotaxis protein CheC [Leptothoe spongobia]|uniref:Chemotaxis protein CheC n=1 Tax=Leptothoe spongobia TAU-MAC 1115 TaxID=1967444 RepID=A0A947DHZ9_9CYAN|nr:chemotaxis protein CheC [Leptothoe spongobia]MBT9317360.1 chemotaxis protein CheC [Leptothoe spongobia TAU-MAC 1115]